MTECSIATCEEGAHTLFIVKDGLDTREVYRCEDHRTTRPPETVLRVRRVSQHLEAADADVQTELEDFPMGGT